MSASFPALYDIIVGIVPGVTDTKGGIDDSWNDMIERVQAVKTRQAAKRDKHGERSLKVAEVMGQTVTREKFVELQKQDQTL